MTNIEPFTFYVHEDRPEQASLLLTVFKEREHVFAERADEGWMGGGYDWASVAQVVLDEKTPELLDKISFDPESSMFVAYGETPAVMAFAKAMKDVYDNEELLRDLLSRAELD